MVRGAHVRQGGDVGARNGARVWTAGWGDVGSVVSGPLSTALVNRGLAGGAGDRQIGYETQYGWLIVFTGVTALLGGGVGVGVENGEEVCLRGMGIVR